MLEILYLLVIPRHGLEHLLGRARELSADDVSTGTAAVPAARRRGQNAGVHRGAGLAWYDRRPGTGRTVRRAHGRPAADQHDALALRFVADLSMEQTAAALGRSSGATKMLVTRGLSAVRTRMRRDAKKEEDS